MAAAEPSRFVGATKVEPTSVSGMNRETVPESNREEMNAIEIQSPDSPNIVSFYFLKFFIFLQI